MNKKAIIGGVIIVLSILALTFTCKSGYFKGKKVIKGPDKITELIDSKKSKILNIDSIVKLLKLKDDSLRNKDVKNVHHYHTVYKTIYSAAPDTCKSLLEQLHNQHLTVDSVKDERISTLEKVVEKKEQAESEYKDILILKDYQQDQFRDTIAEQRIELKQTKKQVNKEKGKGWLKTIVSSLASFFLGYGTGKLIP